MIKYINLGYYDYYQLELIQFWDRVRKNAHRGVILNQLMEKMYKFNPRLLESY